MALPRDIPPAGLPAGATRRRHTWHRSRRMPWHGILRTTPCIRSIRIFPSGSGGREVRRERESGTIYPGTFSP